MLELGLLNVIENDRFVFGKKRAFWKRPTRLWKNDSFWKNDCFWKKNSFTTVVNEM